MSNDTTTTNRLWMIGAVTLVLVTGLALRYATNILDKRHQEFIGAPFLGRLAMLRLEYAF